ncbi:MAG: hypothetical protein WD851_12310 [Pirellulales bacterium]
MQSRFVMVDLPAADDEEGVERPKPQFDLRTQVNGTGQYRAVLELKDDLPAVDMSLQELQFELRIGEVVLERYTVVVDIAEPEFQAAFLADRIGRVVAATQAATAEETAQLLLKLTPDGQFTDLDMSVAENEFPADAPALTADLQALETKIDRMASLAQREYSA